MELAQENGIEIWIGEGNDPGYNISIPKGYTLEDYKGARTGLSAWGYENMKELWKGCYKDLQSCIAYKPWFKVPDEWK